MIAIVLIREINIHSLTDRDFQTGEIHVSRFRGLIRAFSAFARTDRQMDRQRDSRGVVTASADSGKKSRSCSFSLSLVFSFFLLSCIFETEVRSCGSNPC